MINIHLGDHTLSIGSFLKVMPAFAELGHLLGNDEKYEELMSVPGFFEQDVTEWWLGEVRKQAKLVLDEHEKDLEEYTVVFLKRLIKETDFLAVKESADWDESKHDRNKDGKFAPAGGGSSGESSTKTEAKKRVVQDVIKKIGGKTEAAKSLAKRLGDNVWSKLPPKAQTKAVKAWSIAKAVEHKAMIGFHKSKELAEKVAREKGRSPEQAERTAKILGVIDVAMSWTVNFPAVTAVTGNPIAGKVASFLPLASVSYLAFSAATNPLAVYRAAKNVIKGDGHVKEADAPGGYTEEDIAAVLELLEGSDNPDWMLALILAALDKCDYNLAEAVRMVQ